MPPGMYAIISSLQCPCAPSSLHHLSSLELVRTKVYTSALSHLIECGHASLPACISASLHPWGRDLVGQFAQTSYLGMQIQG